MDDEYFSRIVFERWREAEAEQTIPRWSSLMHLTSILADTYEQTDELKHICYRGLCESARMHMMAMQPKRI